MRSYLAIPSFEECKKDIWFLNSYQEISEFWDAYSLADYWDQTEPAAFEIAGDARR